MKTLKSAPIFDKNGIFICSLLWKVKNQTKQTNKKHIVTLGTALLYDGDDVKEAEKHYNAMFSDLS